MPLKFSSDWRAYPWLSGGARVFRFDNTSFCIFDDALLLDFFTLAISCLKFSQIRRADHRSPSVYARYSTQAASVTFWMRFMVGELSM